MPRHSPANHGKNPHVKIASLRTPFGDRLCLADLAPGRLLDIAAAYARLLCEAGAYRDDALARAAVEIPARLPALLGLDPALGAVRRVFDWARTHADRSELIEDCFWPAAPERLAPPIGRPRTIWCMMANFPRGTDRDKAPHVMQGYLKPVSSLIGAHESVVHPAMSSQVEAEFELAVVIGTRARRLDPAGAMRVVAGYLTFCDLGARDVSALDNHRLDRSRGFDTFGVCGPWFVTADEVADPHALRIRSWVNGEPRQDGGTAEMFHSIPEQLAWLSAAFTLAPGDVLSTGTPRAVAAVKPGDALRGEVEGLGAIETVVVHGD